MPQILFIIIFTAADLPVLVSYLAPFLLAFTCSTRFGLTTWRLTARWRASLDRRPHSGTASTARWFTSRARY